MTRPSATTLLLAALVGSACDRRPPSAPPAAAADEAAHDHDEEAGPEVRASDLDRPLDDLFAQRCEHEKPAFECDECRYQVGVVRAPRKLFEGGLMAKAKVGRQRVELPVTLTGEIRFDERRVTHLGPQSEGIVRRVFVSLGDRVRRGDRIVEIESVGFGEAEGQYQEALAALRLAKKSHERQSQLKAQQITSEREYLHSLQEFESAQIRARAAGEKLVRLGMPVSQLAALEREEAARPRGRVVLRAPAAGTVLSLHAVPGEIARSEESLAVVGDPKTLWLWADLYENDLADVAREQDRAPLRAALAVKAFPGEEFAGVVDFVGPSMDEATRTVKVRISVRNPAGRLRSGMFANVKLFLPSDREVVAVPRGAVLEDEGRFFVFLSHRGDYYVRRPVAAGRAWGDWVEIVRGLAGGETVVTDGCFLLKSDVLRSKMGAGCAD